MDDSRCPEIDRHITHITLEGLAPATVYGRRQCLIRLADYLGMPLLEVTADDILGWRAALQHLSAGTIYNYCTHVREFYRWAALRGLLPRGEDPAEGLPVPRRPERKPRPISEADLVEVVAAAPRRIRLWLDLAAWCGLRACEISRLRCENIHLGPNPYLHVAADATKGIRERIIPLCDYVVEEITAARLPPRGWAFTRRDGRAGPVTAQLVSKIANRHLLRCGVSATLHQLRHRFGTQAYRAGHDILAVKELMGHQSIVTTSLYTLADQPAQVAVVQALPVPPPRQLRAAG